MKKLISLSILFWAILFWSPAGLTNPLVQELEQLYRSLPISDPARAEVVLRIADESFNSGVREDNNTFLKKALKYYDKAIRENKRISNSQKIKIRFQKARIHYRLNSLAKAKNEFAAVYKVADKTTVLYRESAYLLMDIAVKKQKFNESLKYANAVIEGCQSEQRCRDAWFQKSWSHYHLGQYNVALKGMQKVISYGSSVQGSTELDDLLLFASLTNQDSTSIIALLEKYQKPEALEASLKTLSEHYMSQARYEMAIKTLKFVWEKYQKPQYYFSLIELGLAHDQGLAIVFEQLPEKLSDIGTPVSSEMDQQLARIITVIKKKSQWKSQYVKLLDLHLNHFTKEHKRTAYMKDWLEINKAKDQQKDQLENWKTLFLGAKEQQYLNEKLLAIAVDKTDHEQIISLTGELLNAPKLKTSQKVKLSYLNAKAKYDQKQIDEAKSGFESVLAMAPKLASKEKEYAASFLAEIYSKRKQYGEMVSLVSKIEKDPSLGKSASSEIKELKRMKAEGEFILASQDESEKSMDYFLSLCRQKKELPKSCENALVLAEKFKKYPVQEELYKQKKDIAKLRKIYELTGQFKKLIALPAEKDSNNVFKPLIFKQLAQDSRAFSSELKKIINNFSQKKTISRDDQVFLLTILEDSRIYEPSVLKLNLDEDIRNKLLEDYINLYQSKTAGQIVKKSQTRTGDNWDFYRVSEILRDARSIRRIGFYGGNSAGRFNRKRSKIQKFQNEVGDKIKNLNFNSKYIVLTSAVELTEQFQQQILKTPIPNDFTADQKSQIRAQLKTKSDELNPAIASLNELLSAVKEAAQKSSTSTFVIPKFKSALKMGDSELKKIVVNLEQKAAPKKSIFKDRQFASMLKQLQVAPEDQNIVRSIKKHLDSVGPKHLSEYFSLRIKPETQI